MQRWQESHLGREVPRELSEFELQAFFTFSPEEHGLIQRRRGPAMKLGLVPAPTEVPSRALRARSNRNEEVARRQAPCAAEGTRFRRPARWLHAGRLIDPELPGVDDSGQPRAPWRSAESVARFAGQ